jgi:hypothetical protein
MKNSQRAGSQDDRAGTAWIRRWWIGERFSVRLFQVASGLVLAGALVWAGDLVAAMGRTYLPVLFLYRLRGIREPDGYEAFLSGQAP